MAIKKTDNTPQNVLKQTTQMRMWVIIGGISALISVICKVLSSGYLEPFDFGQAALGVVCLDMRYRCRKKSSNYAIRINSKITEGSLTSLLQIVTARAPAPRPVLTARPPLRNECCGYNG